MRGRLKACDTQKNPMNSKNSLLLLAGLGVGAVALYFVLRKKDEPAAASLPASQTSADATFTQVAWMSGQPAASSTMRAVRAY